MSPATTAYLEIFTCRRIGDEGCEHDGDCEWGFACNTCGRWLDDGPCPDHAPLNVPGLQLAHCDAIPRHPHTFFLASEAYPPPCLYCSYEALARQHAPCAHSRHSPWRRWKATHTVLNWLALAGVANGAWVSFDSHCRGCLHNFRWHLSGYILGWPQWKWACVLRGRHWPGAQVMAGVCAKCCPCPGCGSVTLAHGAGCPVGAS